MWKLINQSREHVRRSMGQDGEEERESLFGMWVDVNDEKQTRKSVSSERKCTEVCSPSQQELQRSAPTQQSH